MTTTRKVLPLVALLVLAACGQNAGDVIASFKPRMDEMRARLQATIAALPQPGVAVSSSMSVADPKPVFDAAAGTYNTAFLSAEEIATGDDPAFALNLTSDLGLALAWTGPKNPMADSAMSGSIDGLDKQFEAALATPYAVIYRAVSYAPPKASDATNFEGGNIDMEAFLVRTANATSVASCRIQGESAQEVSYSYKKGDDPVARLEAFAKSTLYDDVRKKLAACLTEQTGGTFVFDKP